MQKVRNNVEEMGVDIITKVEEMKVEEMGVEEMGVDLNRRDNWKNFKKICIMWSIL